MYHQESEDSYIALLSGKEIMDPYAVVRESFKDSSSPVALQDELYELLTLTMRPNYWMSYPSPLVLYKKYKKIFRLFEAGWLIQMIRPEFDLSKKLSIPFKEIEVDQIKSQGFQASSDPLTNEYQSLVKFYSSYSISLLGRDITSLLYDGLMPSVTNCIYEVDGYFVEKVQAMCELIRVLHTIGRFEQNIVLSPRDIDVLTREKAKFFARNNLSDYEHGNNDIFKASDKEELTRALAIIREILSTENFWKLHGNPADILYYFIEYFYVIDYFWCHYQYIVKAGRDISTKWKYPKRVRRELHSQGHEWIDRPWEFLHDEFNKKSIHRWFHKTERLLMDVLSNRNFGTADEHSEVLSFLDELLLLADLLDYEPNEC